MATYLPLDIQVQLLTISMTAWLCRKAINTLTPGDMAVALYNDLDTCPEEDIFSPGSWEKAAVASEATEALWFSTSTAAREPAVETGGEAPATNEVQNRRGVVAGA